MKQGVTVDFRDVAANPKDLEEMLQLTGGGRAIPLIQAKNQLSLGWDGKT